MMEMENKPSLEELIQEEQAATRRSWYEWAESLILAMVVVTIISSCFFRVVGVNGSSMADTLQHGDSLLMMNGFYREPAYGDIVVVQQKDAEPLIKRVIALEGDVISIDPDELVVYLNGEKLDEPYIRNMTPTLYGFTGPYTVPEDCVFVMGDNRADSHDSRDLDGIGAVHESEIMGKAFFRIWPPAGIGGLG